MAIGARKPPLQITSAPRFAEVYWVDFSFSNVLPEFDDVHPGVIIRSGQKLAQPHIVVPMTTVDQTGNVFAYSLPANPNPKAPDRRAWVVCNHLYTVASERLKPMRDRFNNPAYPKLSVTDMHEVGKLVRFALRRIIEASLTPPVAPAPKRPSDVDGQG